MLYLRICGHKVSYQIIFFCLTTAFFSLGSVLLKIFLTLSPSFASCLQLLKGTLSISKMVFNKFLWVLLCNKT